MLDTALDPMDPMETTEAKDLPKNVFLTGEYLDLYHSISESIGTYIYIYASEVQIMLPATNVKTIENL